MHVINFYFQYTNESDVMEKNTELLKYFESVNGFLASYDIDITVNPEYIDQIMTLQNTMSDFSSIDFEKLYGINKITEIHKKIYSKLDNEKFAQTSS